MPVHSLGNRADYLGITGSVLCIIHCLLTPVLLLTTALFRDDTLRTGFLSLDYVFIGINMLAVWSSSQHAPARLARSLWFFLVLFAAGLLLESVHEGVEWLAYGASVGLIVTHGVIIRHCRNHPTHQRPNPPRIDVLKGRSDVAAQHPPV